MKLPTTHSIGRPCMFNDGPTPEPTLRAWGLNRTFGSGETLTAALRDVSVEVYPGQVALLMGPSGSGKSTLLAVLSGLLHPDSGKVVAMGKDLWGLSEKQREEFRLQYCGFIFQGYNLFPALTARQQLEMVLRWGRGAPYREARDKATQMLALLGLSKKANLRPAQLSGGEKQRVAIGRALLSSPRLLLLDEPLSSLDERRKREVMPFLEKLRDQASMPIVYVSHVFSEIERLAGTVVLMGSGRVLAVDSASRVKAKATELR
jgi:putative ABC transport system ATP-binding protein